MVFIAWKTKVDSYDKPQKKTNISMEIAQKTKVDIEVRNNPEGDIKDRGF